MTILPRNPTIWPACFGLKTQNFTGLMEMAKSSFTKMSAAPAGKENRISQ
jgi:hypothetical protein